MIVTLRNSIPIASDKISDYINGSITTALNNITTDNDRFIVNDTIWYATKRKGGVSPCVVNSAPYLSKNFQDNLAKINGWKGETTINGQNFDGYGEFELNGTAYRMKEENVVPFLHAYIKFSGVSEHLIYPYFSIFYGMYYKRELFNISNIPEELHHFFDKEEINSKIKVGVEFETGNIGSSFRAILKLNSLFMSNFIDLGVFITSNDKKNCACRIWPVSNRNGSFVELENRNYRDNVNLPLLEIGFEPDSFDPTAPYLSEQCNTYVPTDTGKEITIDNLRYQVYLGNNNDEILKPNSRQLEII